MTTLKSTPEGLAALEAIKKQEMGYIVGAMPNGHVRFEMWQHGEPLAFAEFAPDEADKISRLMVEAATMAREYANKGKD